ncbi:MAG TPA: ABC transporter substrate-binding protein [Casimicrobiaceae bacterium]|jgi:ABC-type branched-subunit amino acid transport system substrate-binding protein|nr:ABC transporter substrate-binding protein [Casimicrobiaceae bacterium]
MRSAWRWLGGILVAATALAAEAEPGVTATTIVLGQSAAFSGPASELGTEMRAGAMAYFQAINAAGGVYGRKIELRSLDDGYEPDRAAANTKKLIDDGVFLLFGYVGTPTSNASKPIFTAARVPFVGPFTGAESLRNPLNRYIFNIRASYYDETDKIVGQLVGQTLDRIAVFYQNDDYGKAGLAGVERAMQRRNLKIVATGTVERNTVDVAAAVKAIGSVDPQGVVMISAYKSCAAFIKAMRKAGHNPQFMNVSFVGSKALAHEAGPEGRGVGVSQVVPFPWNISARVVKEYQQLLEASTGKQNYSWTSLEGFIAAKVLVEGLRRTGTDLTRERFIAAMEQIRDFDVGGFVVTFTPTDHSGSRFVELTVIGKDERFLR